VMRLLANLLPPRTVVKTRASTEAGRQRSPGASAFLLKDAAPEDLLAAIDTVARGDALLAPAVTRAVVEAFVRSSATRPELASALDELTTREREVLC